MKKHIEEGKKFSQRYQDACFGITVLTERLAEESRAIYESAYGLNVKTITGMVQTISIPAEDVAAMVTIVKSRLLLKYKTEIKKQVKEKCWLETEISDCGLTAIETAIYYLRHGLNKRAYTLAEIAGKVFYSERTVKRHLEKSYVKIGTYLEE